MSGSRRWRPCAAPCPSTPIPSTPTSPPPHSSPPRPRRSTHAAACFSSRIDDITEADRRLGADLPGRLTLAHALLRHDGTDERAGGLRIAATLISRWRSGVPALLPAVAEQVSDAHPENRVFALRVLAMCGAAAHPWADLVATHLTPAA